MFSFDKNSSDCCAKVPCVQVYIRDVRARIHRKNFNLIKNKIKFWSLLINKCINTSFILCSDIFASFLAYHFSIMILGAKKLRQIRYNSSLWKSTSICKNAFLSSHIGSVSNFEFHKPLAPSDSQLLRIDKQYEYVCLLSFCQSLFSFSFRAKLRTVAWLQNESAGTHVRAYTLNSLTTKCRNENALCKTTLLLLKMVLLWHYLDTTD